jgi:hypothetical protein
MVLEMIRRGRLVLKSNKAQRRPRVSKLRAKGLSDYYSCEWQPRQSDGGASGPNKRATLMTHLLKKRRVEKQLFGRAKCSPPKKSITDKERTLTLSSGV